MIQEQNKTLTDSPLLLDCKTVDKTVGFSLKISKEIGKVSPTLTSPPTPPPAETKTFLKETWDQGEKIKMAPESHPRVQSIINFIVISTFVLNFIDMA